jgi:hypothetical protein
MMLSMNGIRQPQIRKWSPEIQLNTSTAMFASIAPAGPPICDHDVMKPRWAFDRAHSIDNSTEPPHSPPTPTPWMKRMTVRMTAPQTPACW